MSDHESRPRLVEDLIGVMQLQAEELEKLVVHIEQAVGRLPEESQLAVVASELSELKQRAQGLGASTGARMARITGFGAISPPVEAPFSE